MNSIVQVPAPHILMISNNNSNNMFVKCATTFLLPPLRFINNNRTTSVACKQQECCTERSYGKHRHLPTERLSRDGLLNFTLFAAHVFGSESKLKLAIENGMLIEGIGIDLVAKGANDVVTTGALPIWFTHCLNGLDDDHVQQVQRGIAIASKQCGCYSPSEQDRSLEMSSYGGGEVKHSLGGLVESNIIVPDWIIDGKNIKYGDILIGLPSSGLHSNGFTLATSVIERSNSSLKDNLPGTDFTLGESLMIPTAIYAKQVRKIIKEGGVKGIVHIKGGGLIKNISRVLPAGLGAVIFGDSWSVPPIFKWIQEAGRIEEVEMERTYNMGIGMVLVVSNECALRILGKYAAYRIGVVVSGDGVGYE